MSDSSTEPRWSWNQPICFHCFAVRNPARVPVRIKPEDFADLIERCVDCGRLTIEGIWLRVDPATAAHPTQIKD